MTLSDPLIERVTLASSKTDLVQRLNVASIVYYVRLFSERELTFTFAICYRPSVCRLSVCLSSVVYRLSVCRL